MLCIFSDTHSTYHNIATEEYLMEHFEEDIFYLYINQPSIIVGKHQNTLSEINYEYVKANQIPVVRRRSGGGAVFHDLGNLNFCFITKKDPHTEVSFETFTAPILKTLQNLDIDAAFSGRNDLTIDGKKFSGNAQYFSKDKLLHHGTLLFSSDITDLSAALKVKPLKYKDKAIKSVASRVTNISSHLNAPLSLQEFANLILTTMSEESSDFKPYELTATDQTAIDALVAQRYDTWDWNFGESPKYSFENAIKCAGGTIEYHLDVKDGMITEAKIHGDFFAKKDIADIEALLKDRQHEKATLTALFENFNLSEYLVNIDAETFVSGLF